MSVQGVGANIGTGTVTVGTSAVRIRPGLTRRKSVLILNTHATNTIAIGGPTVTTGNSVRIGPGQSLEFDEYNGEVFAVSTGAGTDVRFMEVS